MFSQSFSLPHILFSHFHDVFFIARLFKVLEMSMHSRNVLASSSTLGQVNYHNESDWATLLLLQLLELRSLSPIQTVTSCSTAYPASRLAASCHVPFSTDSFAWQFFFLMKMSLIAERDYFNQAAGQVQVLLMSCCRQDTPTPTEMPLIFCNSADHHQFLSSASFQWSMENGRSLRAAPRPLNASLIGKNFKVNSRMFPRILQFSDSLHKSTICKLYK